MRHKATQDLFAYWDRRRGAGLVPQREQIEPGEIRHLLADTFILGETSEEHDIFRLAGTHVCALFGRELRGTRFVDLFVPTARPALRSMISAALEDKAGAVAHLRGIAEGDRAINLELLLLPLGNSGADEVRMLGLIVALENAYWIGAHAVEVADIVSFRHVGPVLQRFAVPALATNRSAAPKLVLHQGGRLD